MNNWQPEETAPIDVAVLVFDGDTIAVGRKFGSPGAIQYWIIDESFGFNEDGQIYNVSHWMILPEAPK